MADRVKLIAGALICIAAFGGFGFLLWLLPPLPNWIYPILGVPFVLFVTGFVTAKFNPRRRRNDADVRRLEEAGLVESADFRAERAFEVKEFEDEGPHYFLELADCRVLYLSGQYLYEYEPRTGKSPKPRQFPCTDFIVRRHRTERYGIEVICRGVPFDPEVVAPPWTADEFPASVPEDGQILERHISRLKQSASAPHAHKHSNVENDMMDRGRRSRSAP